MSQCKCDEIGDNGKCFVHGEGSEWAMNKNNPKKWALEQAKDDNLIINALKEDVEHLKSRAESAEARVKELEERLPRYHNEKQCGVISSRLEAAEALVAKMREALVRVLSGAQSFKACMDAQRHDAPLPPGHDDPDESCGDGVCFQSGATIEQDIDSISAVLSTLPSQPKPAEGTKCDHARHTICSDCPPVGVRIEQEIDDIIEQKEMSLRNEVDADDSVAEDSKP